jgi:hypothetical protein
MTPNPSANRSARRHVVAAAFAAGHALLAIVILANPSEGSWGLFPAFVIDFPFSLVWLLLLQSLMSPGVFFVLFGSAWWYVLVFGAQWLFGRLVAGSSSGA